MSVSATEDGGTGWTILLWSRRYRGFNVEFTYWAPAVPRPLTSVPLRRMRARGRDKVWQT